MKVLYWMILFSLLFAVFVGAGCTDTDGGPVDIKKPANYLLVPGTTVDTFKTSSDVCVREELSDKKVSESPWLREYYCSNGLAKHRDFKCTDFDFELCVTDGTGSYCKSDKPVSKSASSSSSAVKKDKAILADFYCGSKVMNRADAECYPPGKLCVKDRLPGQCNNNCRCVSVGGKSDESAGAEKKVVEGSGDSAEKPVDSVKPEASLDIVVPKQGGVSANKSELENSAGKKFEESPIKQTVTLKVISAVANGARKIWGRFLGLF